jgi:hypothetical protein
MAKKKTAERSLMMQITLLHPKPEPLDEDLALLFKEVYSLQKHIPYLIAVLTGENQSTRHRGSTHGIVLHFEDERRMRDVMTQPTYQKLL